MAGNVTGMAHLVLDVNETLSDMAPIATALEGHGAPAGTAGTWFASVLRDGFALSIHHRAPAFLDLARSDLERCLAPLGHLDSPVTEVVEHVLDTLARLDVHDDVVPGLTALADAGHVLTAFSNGSAAATRDLLDRAGVLHTITHVLSVEDGDVWKPHPEAYAAAAAALGRPSALTMVAVHPWDIDGAASAGWRTAWLDRGGSPWPASFRPPDRRVRVLAELRD